MYFYLYIYLKITCWAISSNFSCSYFRKFLKSIQFSQPSTAVKSNLGLVLGLGGSNKQVIRINVNLSINKLANGSR
jgi:hypothetical protein